MAGRELVKNKFLFEGGHRSQFFLLQQSKFFKLIFLELSGEGVVMRAELVAKLRNTLQSTKNERISVILRGCKIFCISCVRGNLKALWSDYMSKVFKCIHNKKHTFHFKVTLTLCSRATTCFTCSICLSKVFAEMAISSR